MKAPDKIVPQDGSDYFRVMTRAVFQAGFNWKVIENKWPGFEEAFASFDPSVVAAYTPAQIDALYNDTGIVRNVSKIDATIHNAQTLLEREREYGSFQAYLSSIPDFETKVKVLRKSFKWLGDFGAYYFLWVVKEPVPSYEDWCESRGISPLEAS